MGDGLNIEVSGQVFAPAPAEPLGPIPSLRRSRISIFFFLVEDFKGLSFGMGNVLLFSLF